MSEPITICQRVRRLIRYRYPLVVAAALNGLILVGVPAMKPRSVAQTTATAAQSASKGPTGPHPSSNPKGNQGAQIAHLERESTQPEAAGDHAVTDHASRSAVAGSVRVKTGDVQRLHGIGQTVWRAGVTAAAFSNWYQSVPKSDPFTDAPTESVALSKQQRPLDAQASTHKFPKTSAIVEQLSEKNSTPASEDGSTRDPKSTSRQLVPQSESRQVVLRNGDSELSVAFVVEGRVFLLQPGASLQWGVTRELSVAFDRGGDFGAARESLSPGVYIFRVDAKGWRLLPDAAGPSESSAADATENAQAERSSS